MFLIAAITLTVLPTLLAVIGAIYYSNFPRFVNISVLILPVIPFAYIYMINRGWAEGMELRGNRLISVIIYSGLLLGVAVLLTFFLAALVQDPNYHLSIGIALAFLLGLGTLYIYPIFQSWIEKRLLGIPLPPTQLLERYTARITTSLGSEELVRLLRDEVFPSLLVRQAALLRFDPAQAPAPVFVSGVTAEMLPQSPQIPALLAQAGLFPRSPDDRPAEICSWALLVLPMSIRGQVVGLCLLGKRDPDDSYSPAEIRTLQALLDQTAMAMVNIEQAERLRALYQKDIERQEMERSHLARELHDDVLNQLGILWMSVDERQAGEQFAEAYQTSVHRIREIISGLRPGMLMYGLRFALEELTEETATQVGGDIAIQLEIPPSDVRYPPDVELHVFRIAQQACQNALKHSRAQGIYIRGQLDPGELELLIEDDGIGFTAGEHLDLPRLLVNRHFGLAGMHERAALIGAEMLIDSAPGKGTRVRIVWNTETSVDAGLA
jgi:signal transduction histidine kinase